MKSRVEQKKWNDFKAAFKEYKDKRIVLYGIGIGAVLVTENDCFQFVGLMDRDPANIGRIMYGLPIISLAEAENIADMIVINAPETYWEIIYKRIENSKIPVYFRNGEKAHITQQPKVTAEEIRKELQGLSVDDVTEKIITNICSKLFSDKTGQTVFQSLYSFGYCLWGPIVYTFCEWLYFQSKKRGIRQLLFLSRDGYLLQKDYEFFVTENRLGDAPASKYLLTSRRIAYVASIESEDDFQKWLLFSFNGTFAEYMWNRFMVDVSEDENAHCRIQMPHDIDKIQDWIKQYESQIKYNIERDRSNYITYLKEMDLDNIFALVDIGYIGTIQSKLGRLMKRQLTGFYFVCDLSAENECSAETELIPCFQEENDSMADKTCIYRKPQLLESMFTAPHGMVMAVDEHLEKICMPSTKNQDFFEDRVEINRGVQSFIHDLKKKEWGGEAVRGGECHDNKITNLCLFSDKLFGVLLNRITLSPDIEKIFYWDDAIVQARENMIFN